MDVARFHVLLRSSPGLVGVAMHSCGLLLRNTVFDGEHFFTWYGGASLGFGSAAARLIAVALFQ